MNVSDHGVGDRVTDLLCAGLPVGNKAADDRGSFEPSLCLVE
jgi:hypothetical protein